MNIPSAFSKHRDWIDLRFAETPLPPLLLVNQQIYAESRGLYRQSYHDYWSTNHFYLDIATVTETDKLSLRGRSLTAIRHLDLIFQEARISGQPSQRIHRSRLIDTRGIWKRRFYRLGGVERSLDQETYGICHKLGDSYYFVTSREEEVALRYCMMLHEHVPVYEQVVRIIEVHLGSSKVLKHELVPCVLSEELKRMLA